MKVKELIGLLNTLDPETDVLQYDEEKDRFYETTAGTVFTLETESGTRDFSKVIPKGTTKVFLCL